MSTSAPPEDPGAARARGVMIARGSGGDDLRALAGLLDSAGIDFGVEEALHPDGSDQSWQVFVRPRDVLRARSALQQLIGTGPAGAHAAPGDPPSGPLFEGGGLGLTRSFLMLACFGLGVALLLRGCAG